MCRIVKADIWVNDNKIHLRGIAANMRQPTILPVTPSINHVLWWMQPSPSQNGSDSLNSSCVWKTLTPPHINASEREAHAGNSVALWAVGVIQPHKCQTNTIIPFPSVKSHLKETWRAHTLRGTLEMFRLFIAYLRIDEPEAWCLQATGVLTRSPGQTTRLDTCCFCCDGEWSQQLLGHLPHVWWYVSFITLYYYPGGD